MIMNYTVKNNAMKSNTLPTKTPLTSYYVIKYAPLEILGK